jgi:hypothetical protein
MGFLVFAPLCFVLLRLSVRWRWRTVLLVSLVVGVVADALLDFAMARRQ